MLGVKRPEVGGTRLGIRQNKACAAVVVELRGRFGDVPQIAQREVAAAAPRLEGTCVAARTQGQLPAKSLHVGILAGGDAPRAFLRAHREAVVLPSRAAFVPEIDTENPSAAADLPQVAAPQPRTRHAVAQAFGREQPFRPGAPKQGMQPGDLAGSSREEYPAALAQGCDDLRVDAVKTTLHVFGLEKRSNRLKCLRPAMNHLALGCEGGAEDNAAAAGRRCGQQREDAARRAGGAHRRIPGPCGKALHGGACGRGMPLRTDPFAQSAAGAALPIRYGVAESLLVFLHADAVLRTAYRARFTSAAETFVADGLH